MILMRRFNIFFLVKNDPERKLRAGASDEKKKLKKTKVLFSK